jgi:hypothetical protein
VDFAGTLLLLVQTRVVEVLLQSGTSFTVQVPQHYDHTTGTTVVTTR